MGKPIDEISELLKKNYLSVSDINFFMSNVRIYMEENKISEQYKHLNLYCNWCFHSKLSQSMVGFRILEMCSSIFEKNKYDRSANLIISSISDALSTNKLKSEGSCLLKSMNLSPLIFEVPIIWNGFLGTLMRIILNRPITFPSYRSIQNNPKYKKIYERWLASTSEAGFRINAVSFFLRKDQTIGLRFETEKGVFIESPFIL